MGTLYHFGDSYGTVGSHDKHFVNLISERMDNINYNNQVTGGLSNEQILTKLLSCVMNIQKGDMLFFNFSFFVRGCYYDRELGELKSTNYYYNDISKFRIINTEKDYIMDIVTYQLDYNEDYNRRVFNQFNTIFEQLHLMDIPIYYIFIVENEWSDTLLKYGNKISFPTDFYTWLDDNDYHRQEECHYTRGIQENIYHYVMGQMKKGPHSHLI
jgi:hypothetical protein